jgi:transposase-like protein
LSKALTRSITPELEYFQAKWVAHLPYRQAAGTVESDASIAARIGCTPETLRTWICKAERDRGLRPGMSTETRERIKELEREVRELRQVNEILRKASAYFR